MTTTPQHVTIIAAALFLAACTKPPAENTATPLVSVSASTVTLGDVAQPVVATGTFGPRDEIPLAFKSGGVISRITVDAGQSVTKGQLLAVLDLREIDAMLDKATVGVD